MLVAKGIRASYKDNVILGGVDMHLHQGEFAGIIGPNGTGKTTLLKVLAGVKKPLSGSIILDKHDIKTLSRTAIARIMAVVPQSCFVPPLFTVDDVVCIGRYAHRRSRFTTDKADIVAIENAFSVTGTGYLRNRYMSELSGGERQEILIARALAQEPKLLLLDEPTANLDIGHQMKILGLVRKLVDTQGLTALMVIHDLNLASRFCSRLFLLNKGVVLSEGSVNTVLTERNLTEAYDVSSSVEYNGFVNALQVTVIDYVHNKNYLTEDNDNEDRLNNVAQPNAASGSGRSKA